MERAELPLREMRDPGRDGPWGPGTSGSAAEESLPSFRALQTPRDRAT